MLNVNNRPITVISQSFIASEFQGYTDPYTTSNPTSSLNQFVKSKKTSDSGFIHEADHQSFGFNNLTSIYQPNQLQKLSRNAQQSTRVNVFNPNVQVESRPISQTGQPIYPNQAQYINQVPQQNRLAPQQGLQERYVSPLIVKTQSPVKRQPIIDQQYNNVPQKAQFANSQNNQGLNKVQNEQPGNQGQRLQQNQYRQQQAQLYEQGQSQTQQYQHQTQQVQQGKQIIQQVQQAKQQPIQNKLQKSQSYQLSKLSTTVNSTVQRNKFNQQNVDTSYIKKERSSNSLQNTENSSVARKFKLNVSQEFSDSFTLTCVNQPQKSSILQMKKRQREFRKSIHNFFV